jgi:putative heme-binding domain-containing protein
VDGSSNKAGPDLYAVGDKYSRGEIIESTLLPSASIAPGYSSTTIETTNGESFTGVVKQATNTWIELMGGDGKLIHLRTAEIQRQQTSEISFMPEGLCFGLTAQEFTDLVEYLVSLKQPVSQATIRQGMPGKIESLPKAVGLSDFMREDLSFEHPVWFGQIPGMSNDFLVVEHETGKVWRLEKSSAGDKKTIFGELGGYQPGTRGLLGLVLHPKYRQNGKYYFAKHLVQNGQFATIVFEGRAHRDGLSDSGYPARRLIKFDEATNVHYGGGLAFGADGYLYIGMGDSGPQGDPQGHAQDPSLFLGKMLRVDVDHLENGLPYAVPPDNPFIGRADIRPEIWAWGLREPWRFSFDLLTGDLWAGDVGQDRYEEVDILRPGENYGWNVYEGFERFSTQYQKAGVTYVAPVFAYGRKFGVSVTGGFVYRGNASSSFYGVYIFGDFQSRRIWGLRQENRTLKVIREIGTAPQRIVAFGQDEQGELYLVGYEGMIYRLELSSTVFE